MNKFSSFKHQQRLFENWRSFCEDNNIQQEEGYLLVESGPLHSREKRNFNSLLEEVIDGSIPQICVTRCDRSVVQEIDADPCACACCTRVIASIDCSCRPYCCPCGRSLYCAGNGVQAGGDSEIVDERVVGVDVS